MCPTPSIQTTDDHSTSVGERWKSLLAKQVWGNDMSSPFVSADATSNSARTTLTGLTIKGDPNAYHLWLQVT